MEIHRPKAPHGWRELAKEVGIIVIGMLIALGAEQAVQGIEWHHKTEAAEQAMRLELGKDDGPQLETLRRDNATIFTAVALGLPATYATGVRLDPDVVRRVDKIVARDFDKACRVTPPGPGPQPAG